MAAVAAPVPVPAALLANVNDANCWRTARGEAPIFTPANYAQLYRSRNYRRRDWKARGINGPDFTYYAPRKALKSWPITPEDRLAAERFLLTDLNAELQIAPAGAPPTRKWKGTRLLGQGSFGRASLFEWTGRRADGIPVPAIMKVVVKDALPGAPAGILNREATLLDAIDNVNTLHLNHLYRPHIVDANANVVRMFLMYCELGDLNKLITKTLKASKSPVHFEEITLWHIFECLVDAATALWYGAEAVKNPDDGPNPDVFQVPEADRPANWENILHFDLKPENIFLDERDAAHPELPVFKFGDFGLSRFLHDLATWPQRENARFTGTTDYYTPEQFTERWDFNDWQSEDIAGVYRQRMMVWSIGVLMYQLTVLDCDPPVIQRAFNHPGMADQPDSRTRSRRTYGERLHAVSARGVNTLYSNTLTDLIHSCLYERPNRRPRLKTLKGMIRLNKNALRAGGAQPDPYKIFLPEPLPPPQINRVLRPPAEGLTDQQCTYYNWDKEKFCENFVMSPPAPPGARCNRHPVVAFPYQLPNMHM